MKTISFFSYKGGSGRSSIAYNTLPYLAENLNATPERPIVIVDADIDSAGLSFLFESYTKKVTVFTQDICDNTWPGQDLNRDTGATVATHPLFLAIADISDAYGLPERSILFIPARTKSDVNASKMNSYNGSRDIFDRLKSLCSNLGCQALLFDCPTGDQATATSSIATSSTVVVVMRITSQFRKGTYTFLERMDKQYRRKRLVIVPNAVPKDQIRTGAFEKYDYDHTRNEIIEKIDKIMLNNRPDFRMLKDGRFGVPEVTLFKFREAILYSWEYEKTSDMLEALEMYKEVANTITAD